jgi:hypothetical protein
MEAGVTVDRFESRGVFHLPGRVRCPLAGVGGRGDHDSNRLVLDDADSRVTVDRTRASILIENDRRYARKRTVADLLFLADGTTRAGAGTPLAVHLKVFKAGAKVTVDLHRHLRSSEPIVAATFEPFEVVVRDGRREQTLLTPASTGELICRPPRFIRLVRSFMLQRDNLEGVAAGSERLADLTLGFRAGPFEWPMVRAELRALGGAPAGHGGGVRDFLRDGAWELRLTALSTRLLNDVIRRDLFLFGLDRIPLLGRVHERGLLVGETLAFRFERGEGSVLLGDRSAELPDALDVARSYVEFHLLGGLLADQAERRLRD